MAISCNPAVESFRLWACLHFISSRSQRSRRCEIEGLLTRRLFDRAIRVDVSAFVLGLRVATIFFARVFTDVVVVRLDEVVFVLELCVSVLVVCDVCGWLHEAFVRRAERHVCASERLGGVDVAGYTVK